MAGWPASLASGGISTSGWRHPDYLRPGEAEHDVWSRPMAWEHAMLPVRTLTRRLNVKPQFIERVRLDGTPLRLHRIQGLGWGTATRSLARRIRDAGGRVGQSTARS